MSRARFALVFAVVSACLLPEVASAQTTVQGQIIIQEAPPSTSVAPAPQAQVYAQPVMVAPQQQPQMQCPVGSTLAVDAYGRPQCMMETTRHRVIGGLLGGGIGLLAGGWVLSIVTGLVESVALAFGCAFGGCSSGDSSSVLGWGFVPLIGSLVQLAYFPGSADTGLYAWHITESVLQIGGLIMLIFGAIGEETTEMTPVQGYALNVQPIVTGSSAGLAATLTF
jgi:hypothetical protein